MRNRSSEEWEKIHKDWGEHWRNRPDDYTIAEWLDKFWADRGGRESYYPKDN